MTVKISFFELLWLGMKLTNRIEKITSLVSGKYILDIGCTDEYTGSDNVSWDKLINSDYWLHGHLRKLENKIIYGIDIIEEQINNLKLAGLDNLYVQDISELSLDQKFDTIVAGEIIEHISNFESFFNSVRKYLNQDGILIVSTPYIHSLAYVIYSWLRYPKTNHNPDHTVGFCPSTIETLAKKNNFEIINLELVPDYPPIFPGRYTKFLYISLRLFGSFFPKRIIFNDMVVVLKPKS